MIKITPITTNVSVEAITEGVNIETLTSTVAVEVTEAPITVSVLNGTPINDSILGVFTPFTLTVAISGNLQDQINKLSVSGDIDGGYSQSLYLIEQNIDGGNV